MGYTLSDKITKDDFEFLQKSYDDYQNGKLDKAEFKVIRVSYGIYEQRELDTYMVRVKSCGGDITNEQLLGLAKLSKIYANSKLHITTRGGIQFHYVRLGDICSITKDIHALELTGRGGGGNTVRNIVCDPLSGIAKDSVFDVRVYANAITSKILTLKNSYSLPRKYKISFSSSSADRGMATITDVGFIATTKDGEIGFKLYIAGGMGSNPTLGLKFRDFIPASECFLYAEAIKRVFDKHGNRENKHKARLRHLRNKIGEEALVNLIESELENLRNSDFDYSLELEESLNLEPVNEAKFKEKDGEFQIWKQRYLKLALQNGYYYALIPLGLGDIKADDGINLAKALPKNRDTLTFTTKQNLIIKNLTIDEFRAIYPSIKAIAPLSQKPKFFANLVACAGAGTCQLGICKPRGVVSELYENLSKTDLEFDKLADLKVQLSGCHNSCANHLISDIGFFGRTKKNLGVAYPVYNVVVGGFVGDERSKFAKIIAQIPAFYLPNFLYEVLKDYTKSDSNFDEYLQNGGEERIIAIANSYQEIPSFDDDKRPYYDWGSDELFKDTLKSAGIGEEN
ncbi:MAG: nitrite/sulfite reductase [Campylobacter sp.]|nr:nitrite/sulfite reductase [Campylobacter sp.]